MPVDWSSSSSDEELQTALRRNARLRNNEERALPTLLPLTTIYNGNTIEIRFGTIYCPFRKRYFHIRSAKQNPADFFGDGSVRKFKRSYLSASSVQLLNVSYGEEGIDKNSRITLEESNDKGFYIFDGIKSFSFSSTISVTSNYSLLKDFRYFRIISESRFKDALSSPVRLFSQDNRWKNVDYKISPKSVVANFPDCRFVFSKLVPQPVLCVVENDNLLSHPIDISFNEDYVIGMHPVNNRSLIVVTGKRLHYLNWDPDFPSVPKTLISSLEFNGSFSYSCSNSLLCDPTELFVTLASDRSIFYANIYQDRPLRPVKLCTFRTTPISSIDTYSMGPLTNKVVICGMRNGTIQFQPLENMRTRQSFDCLTRHKAACISYIHCVQNTFNFVSIASNGEIKLWDTRYMNKIDPVAELDTGIAIGRFYGVQAAFADDIACVAIPNGHISCFNMKKWISIGQYQREGGTESRIHLVRSNFGYQMLEASENETKVFSLQIV